jgi:hypothetical protein
LRGSDLVFVTAHHVGDTLWLTGNSYKAPVVGYDTVYVGLGADERVVKEDQGVLPTMFIGPDGKLWAVVTNPFGDRDCEVVRPVGGPPHKGRKPFVGTPLWLEGNVLVLASSDLYSSDKPDRWLRYDLATEKTKVIRLPLPSGGKFIRNAEGIQCLARTQHRLLSPTGDVLRERALALEGLAVQPVDLRFNGASTALAHDRDTLWWLTIGTDGTVRHHELKKGPFYALYAPQRAAEMLVARYVDETGNGWVCIREGRLVSWVHSTETGYADGDGRTVVALPRARWILSGLSILGEEIAASVYEKNEQAHHPAALCVARVSLT